MAGPRTLTTTSYAILGLLSLRPWTTYELAQQMQRSLGHFWPRAESKLYEEPKKLVEHGLAKATVDHVGKRPRTVYAITPAGRRALRAWMPEPSAGPAVEFEGLVRVFFAEHGTKADLLAAIDAAHEWVDRRYEDGRGINRGYLEGQGAFPERLPWLILVGRFFQEMMDAVERWATWANETVEAWPDDVTDAAPDLVTLERMAIADESHVPRGRREER
jgi:PadR family transcriptional regulator, regulatory protein AphA